MKHTFEKTPGYDCIRAPCGKHGCGTDPGSSHGIHNDEWRFVVSDGTRALSLDVQTGIFPDTVPVETARALDDYPRSYNLALHVAFPSDRESVLVEPSDCEYLDDGKCWNNSYSMSAADGLLEGYRGVSRLSPGADPLVLQQASRGGALVPGDTLLFAQLEAAFTRLVVGVEPSPFVRCAACSGTGTHMREGSRS